MELSTAKLTAKLTFNREVNFARGWTCVGETSTFPPRLKRESAFRRLDLEA